jgi:large subunit ribosomal protein L13
MNKTPVPTQENLEKKWYVVDAADQRLGRLATEIAMILRGKNKPTYTPHMDTGDYVIVVNAEKVTVTGRKKTTKALPSSFGKTGRNESRNFRAFTKTNS